MDAAVRAFAFCRVGRFLWIRRVWLLAVPPLLLAGTIVHELAHALAVAAQGGTIRDLDILPSMREGSLVFGHVTHERVPHLWLVWIAPTLLWTLVSFTTVIRLARVKRPRLAGALLFTLVLLPLVDLSFSFAGLFLGRPGTDLHRALAGHETLAGLAMNLIFILLGRLGWLRLRALAPTALSATEFTICYLVLLSAPWLVP
jgi:hypothetical protein